MMLAPGIRLGPYEVRDRLGRGGMGEVYRASDTRLGRSVAIKVLPAEVADDPERRRRLLLEARAAASLSHPGICTLYEVGEHNGCAFIAMEHIDGRTIADLLEPGGLPAEDVLRFGIQIADALAYAHDHGVVHRDLKCTNVMVTAEGRAKVVDFGLARRLAADELEELTHSRESITPRGAVVGTVAYMAPEVLAGRVADARCDIWALGVLLHVMASGRPPFAGGTVFELTAAILREPPAALPAHVLPGLRAIVRHCLAKGVTERYQRASEVRAALESTREDLAVDVPGGSPTFAADTALEETTLAFESSAAVASHAAAASPPSSSSVEIQTLNRIASALDPIIKAARIVAAVSVGLVVVGFLGLLTSATFDLALHLPIAGSVFDYIVFGTRALLPPTVLMLTAAAVLAAVLVASRLLARLAAKLVWQRKSGDEQRGFVQRARDRLEAISSASLVRTVAVLAALAVTVIVLVSLPTLRVIEQLIELPPSEPVATDVLSPASRGYHFLVSWVTALASLALVAVWWVARSAIMRQEGEDSSLSRLRWIALSGLLVAAMVVVTPWRLIWDNERPEVRFEGEPAFVVREAGDRLFLYVPTGSERYLDVAAGDSRLARPEEMKRRNIFSRP